MTCEVGCGLVHVYVVYCKGTLFSSKDQGTEGWQRRVAIHAWTACAKMKLTLQGIHRLLIGHITPLTIAVGKTKEQHEEHKMTYIDDSVY